MTEPHLTGRRRFGTLRRATRGRLALYPACLLSVTAMNAACLRFASVLTLSAAVIGCSGDAEPEQSAAAAPRATSAAVEGPQQQIQQTVTNFLEAVRQGNTNLASAQLTPLALERIRAHNMTISPPASETARFTVGDVELIDADKAIVASIWTDLDVDGQWYDQNTTWALRRGEGQWRISGMAEELGPDQPPLVIDFENPGALVQSNQSDAAAGTSRQAAQPASDPFQEGVTR